MPKSLIATAARAAGVLSMLPLPLACAWAQDAAQETTGQEQRVQQAQASTLDAIVVTGERMDRSLRNTASSVSTRSAEDLEEQVGRDNVKDVLADIPNVLYQDTVSAPVIRGQDTQGANFGASAFLGGTVPRATVNVDGRYLGYYDLVFGATSLWDVEGIEVFRGPQTSSQGANSIAGSVIVNTKDPTFHREGAAQLQYGSDNTRRASVALSGPIVEQELAARLAVDYQARNTFIDYVNPSFAKGDSDQDFKSVDTRLKLLWKPSRIPGLQAKLTFSHATHNRPTSEAASTPYEDNESRTASMPSYKQRANTVIADLNYEFRPGLRLSNRTAFTDLSVRRVAAPWNNGGADIDQHNASNETRLSFGNEASVWSGMAGVYYNRTTSDDKLYIRGVSSFDDRKGNLGLFTEVSRRLSDRWRLTGGLRYQRDQIKRSGTSPYATDRLDFDKTFDAVLPKVSLAYDITPHVTVGGLVSKGYNPGGTGLSFAQQKYIDFKEETVWNYELFSRASLLGGRMTLTGNVFYSDFRNSQRLLPDYLNGVLYGAVVVNADKARSYGAELEMDYQALENLRLRAGLGLMHSRIRKVSGDEDGALQGKEFGRAPGYMISVGADWNVTQKLKLSADVRRTDSYYSTDENLPAYRIGGYTVANARVSYQIGKGVEVFGYANNVFDKRAPTWKYDDRTAGGIAASMLTPRQIGMGVKAFF